MNLMGERAHHSILSAMPGALGARDAIDPAIIVDFPKDAPPLHGKPSLGRYRDLANYMTRFDLVLSYNRSEEHTSELQSLMRNSYAVFCLKKKKQHLQPTKTKTTSTIPTTI